jgi:hypothetical protein
MCRRKVSPVKDPSVVLVINFAQIFTKQNIKASNNLGNGNTESPLACWSLEPLQLSRWQPWTSLIPVHSMKEEELRFY